MRFHPDEDGSKRPPNYFSRRVQYRLILLVSMFMLVLLAMDRVRDPAMWQWMWAGDYSPASDKSPPASDIPKLDLGGESVNTQLPLQAAPETPAIPDSISTAAPPLGQVPEDGAPRQRTLDDLWARLLQSVPLVEQRTLDRALKRHRDRQPLAPADGQQLEALLPPLQMRAERYFREAIKATEHSTVSDQQQGAWLELLKGLQSQWEQQTVPALASLSGPVEDRTEAMSAQLSDVQHSLDRLAMANIKDNTVMRTDEARAWFRLLEQLNRAGLEALTPEHSRRVGFLQLFRQPNVFRGQLVTVHGGVELAYKLKAPANGFDIESYYILWIRPAGGPANPLVVYALELPEGFPPVADRDAPGQADASTEFDPGEEVDVTGYFFKNWAYRSKEGINTAPLVLARMPDWSPPAPLVEQRAPLTWPLAMASIFGCGLLAAVLALLAFRSSVFPARREDDQAAGKVKTLERTEPNSPSERLAEISRREREGAE